MISVHLENPKSSERVQINQMDSKAKFDFFVHSTWNRLKNKTQKYRKKPTESVRVFGGRFPSVEITEEESVHYTEFIPNVVYKSVQFLQENGSSI